MNDKKYGIYEILIGMFNNFKVDNRRYQYDKDRFDKFFHENKPKYSILSSLKLKNGELEETHNHLIKSRFLTIYDLKPNLNYINKDLFNISFLMLNNPFNEEELTQLEQLSLEFQKEFVR